MLTRESPAVAQLVGVAAAAASPLVVSAIASMPGIAREPADVVDDALAHERLAAGEADLADALADRDAREALDLLEA